MIAMNLEFDKKHVWFVHFSKWRRVTLLHHFS